MPVVKVASAGRQSNCFDRPGDVQRKCSSMELLLVRDKNREIPLCGNSRAAAAVVGWLWSTGTVLLLEKMRGKSQKHLKGGRKERPIHGGEKR